MHTLLSVGDTGFHVTESLATLEKHIEVVKTYSHIAELIVRNEMGVTIATFTRSTPVVALVAFYDSLV